MIVTINAKAFVVPNPADTVREFLERNAYSNIYNYLLEVGKLNGIELNEDDKIVQLWFTCDELNCDNVADHGIITNLGDTPVMIAAYELKYVPLKLINGMNEGDCRIIKVPAIAYGSKIAYCKHDQNNATNIVLEVRMTCQQAGYRYARIGNFEDAVKQVCQ